MLETVLKQVSFELEDCQFCIALSPQQSNDELRSHDLLPIWPSHLLSGRLGKFPFLFFLSKVISRVTPRKTLISYGMCKRDDIDALIDVSGYSFGDHWNHKFISNFALLAKFYRARDRPVVLLPQMLGPFRDRRSKAAFADLARQCDLIFPRDNASMEYATKTAGQESFAIIQQAPDITIFNKSFLRCDPSKMPTGFIALIPNIRVIDRGENPWSREKYVKALIDAGRAVLDSGKAVYVVVHETFGKDAELASMICEGLSLNESHLFSHANPNVLKAYISRADFVIGSRFHSLVAALSTVTPAISIGWAHKYSELFEDFGVSEFDVSSHEKAETIIDLVRLLLDESRNAEIRERLDQAYQRHEKINKAMWQLVIDRLRESRPAGLPLKHKAE